MRKKSYAFILKKIHLWLLTKNINLKLLEPVFYCETLLFFHILFFYTQSTFIFNLKEIFKIVCDLLLLFFFFSFRYVVILFMSRCYSLSFLIKSTTTHKITETYLSFSMTTLCCKWNWATISFTIFWDFSMFYQIFLSPQVKRWAIITYKHGIYELPRDLPNDLRLRILGNYEISGMCINFIKW